MANTNAVNTVTELMNEAVEAYENGDLERLNDLEIIVINWAQMPEERDAQLNMIQAFTVAAENLYV